MKSSNGGGGSLNKEEGKIEIYAIDDWGIKAGGGVGVF